MFSLKDLQCKLHRSKQGFCMIEYCYAHMLIIFLIKCILKTSKYSILYGRLKVKQKLPLYISSVVCKSFFTLSVFLALTILNPLVHSAKASFITFSSSLSSLRISSSLYSLFRTIQFAFNAVRSSAYGTFLSLVN